MNDEHFGSCLRKAREERALTIGDVSASTKVPRSAIEQLESGTLSGLPAHVFVRGFIRSYAKAVGIAESRPLSLFDRAINAHDEEARAKSASPVVDPVLAGGVPDEDEAAAVGAVSVSPCSSIILVLIATITFTLLLRHPPQSGEGLSLIAAGAGSQIDEAGSVDARSRIE